MVRKINILLVIIFCFLCTLEIKQIQYFYIIISYLFISENIKNPSIYYNHILNPLILSLRFFSHFYSLVYTAKAFIFKNQKKSVSNYINFK